MSIPTTTTQSPPTPNSTISDKNYKNYLDENCGVPRVSRPPSISLIKGGMTATRGQFPWLTAYFYTGKYCTEFICGASLISPKLVTTAAHCVEDTEEDSIVRVPEHSIFYIGKNNLETLTGEMKYITSPAKSLHVHPDWKKGTKRYTYDNDIAIAVMAKKIEFNSFIKPICIWRETFSYEDIIDKEGTVVGWGKTDNDQDISSSAAMYAKIPVVSNEKCLRSNSEFAKILGDNAFCAGVRYSNAGPCLGDSG